MGSRIVRATVSADVRGWASSTSKGSGCVADVARATTARVREPGRAGGGGAADGATVSPGIRSARRTESNRAVARACAPATFCSIWSA